MKILLTGNTSINAKVDVLVERVDDIETDIAIKEATIRRNEESVTTNAEKITSLENEITTLKKVIVNQQTFIEQTQRNDLARNIMITGIPNSHVTIDEATFETTEQKVHLILDELNPELTSDQYSFKVFKPFTLSDGTISHSAKVVMNSVELKMQTLANTKSFKQHSNDFFHSIYAKNDETKLSRNENYRLRKKARDLRNECTDDAIRNTIRIEKGILKKNGDVIDKFDINNQIFH